MSAPDKCPECQGETTITADGYIKHVGVRYYDQDYRFCLERQRDQLAARVKELEPFKLVCENPAALWANWLRGTVALPAGIGDVRERDARIKELEAERDTWRAYAGRLEEAGNKMHWAFMHPFDVSHDACPAGWTKAKETKP